jgi:hypothetical protein
LLGTSPSQLRARFVSPSASRARAAFAQLDCLAIDALMAQPLERLERVAMPHPGSVAKPAAAGAAR